MEPDLWTLYQMMLESRLFEEALIQLWNEGKISGEMHIAIGEEAIAAGVLSHIQDGSDILDSPMYQRQKNRGTTQNLLSSTGGLRPKARQRNALISWLTPLKK